MRPKKLVIYLKNMDVENVLKYYIELEVQLRVYSVKRLGNYFIHISSRMLGIYFKIMEVRNLL